MNRETVFSPCRKYRYTLWREWSMEHVEGATADDENYVQFIGLNPSTADETLDDPTIRRCKAFAKSWGYKAMCMTNIFAWRDTDPEQMKKQIEPVGIDNDRWITEIASQAHVIVAAWGKHGKHMYRANAVKRLIPNVKCLKKNGDGSPQHPLYLPATLQPIPLN